MKQIVFILVTVFASLTFAQDGFYTMVTDCKEFSIVNVLPTWKYYDSGVNAYMTKTPVEQLPLVHLDSATSSSFEQNYKVQFVKDQMLIEMSYYGSDVVIEVEIPDIREGIFTSKVVVGNLENNFKKLFGPFANQSFSCESKITKD